MDKRSESKFFHPSSGHVRHGSQLPSRWAGSACCTSPTTTTTTSSLGRALAHRERRVRVRVSIIYSEWDARRAAQSRAAPDFSPFPSREIVSRISAAITGEARRCSCVYTYVRFNASQWGRKILTVRGNVSIWNWQPPSTRLWDGRREREKGREIYERQIGFYASLDSGCNSGSIINTRRCNF